MFFKKLIDYVDIAELGLAEVGLSSSTENRLILAVLKNNTNKVKEILGSNHKIDWSRATLRGDTLLLQMALLEDNFIIFEELLKAGIPVNARDSKKLTILFIAVVWNNKDLVKMLIDYGAKVNIRLDDGNTPLIYAITQTESSEMAKILINAGAKTNIKNVKGVPPLTYAAYSGLTEIVEVLINDGVDINTCFGENNCTVVTALVLKCAEKDYFDMIKYFLSNGADPTIKDGYSKSAIDYAKERNNQRLIKLFASHGYSY